MDLIIKNFLKKLLEYNGCNEPRFELATDFKFIEFRTMSILTFMIRDIQCELIEDYYSDVTYYRGVSIINKQIQFESEDERSEFYQTIKYETNKSR